MPDCHCGHMEQAATALRLALLVDRKRTSGSVMLGTADAEAIQVALEDAVGANELACECGAAAGGHGEGGTTPTKEELRTLIARYADAAVINCRSGALRHTADGYERATRAVEGALDALYAAPDTPGGEADRLAALEDDDDNLVDLGLADFGEEGDEDEEVL